LIVAKSGKAYKQKTSTILKVKHMGTKRRKRGLTVFLDPEDIQILKEKSGETGRSLSTLIREAVKKWIREEAE
jgi:hypothetical protein